MNMMKKIIYFPLIIVFLVSLNGCLIFHKISYQVEVEKGDKGKVTVTAYDIRSDAVSNKEFEEDKNRLFNYLLKDNGFVSQMSKEGKYIKSRELFVNGDTLIGRGVYSFDNINDVEGIQHEGGFYYLTLAPDDSVMFTNGQIIASKDRKRILWEDSVKTLSFEMFSFSFGKNKYRKLASYYKK